MSVHAFPFTHFQKLVELTARDMRALDEAAAETRLVQELETIWTHLETRGVVTAEIEAQVLAFASAVLAKASSVPAEMLDRAVGGIRGMRRGRDRRLSLSVAYDPPAPARPLIDFKFPNKVVLFSPVRPREYVERVASIFLEYDQPKGEHLLALEMEVITDKLLALGADPPAVLREIRKLESSIRATMWHQVMGTKP